MENVKYANSNGKDTLNKNSNYSKMMHQQDPNSMYGDDIGQVDYIYNQHYQQQQQQQQNMDDINQQLNQTRSNQYFVETNKIAYVCFITMFLVK